MPFILLRFWGFTTFCCAAGLGAGASGGVEGGGFAEDFFRKGQNADQVGHHHQGGEEVCQGPNGGGVQKGAQPQKGKKGGAEDRAAFFGAGEEVAKALLSVVAPANDGRKAEKEQAEHIKKRDQWVGQGKGEKCVEGDLRPA